MKPLVLIILDGWGIAPAHEGNAITQAKLQIMPKLWNTYPHTTLQASGLAVGLPDGEDGNSETGHINLGAGRIVYQDLVRINNSIEDRSFFRNDAFLGAIQHARNHHSNLHIMGLFSDAGVHASRKHLCALLELLKMQNCPRAYVHLITDGRDAPPQSAIDFLTEAHQLCQTFSFAHIATIMGRYYAMDRDFRWERTQKAYEALTEKAQYYSPSAIEAVQAAYERKETDEFIHPTIITDEAGIAYPRIQDNDAIIFFNYRIDRPRQLTRAFVMPDFDINGNQIQFDPYYDKYAQKIQNTVEERDKPFVRNKVLKNLLFVTMTQYEPNMPCIAAFPPDTIPVPLGKVLSDAGLRQLRIAESEKERFVTYYFNGMREQAYLNEDRLIIPSPKVATYDLMPQMSAHTVTEKCIDRISLGLYGFILVNFANPDMVGHTGYTKAAIVACETVDVCVGKIVDTLLKADGTCIITADHGNVEEMLARGMIDTEHSKNPVPFIIVSNATHGHAVTLPTGKLGDVAPTILKLLQIQIPKEMTGNNLYSESISY